MKLRESFEVGQPVERVWEFLEQPQQVAACLPGVEALRVIDPDNVEVRLTQNIGPLSATFEAKVTVTERVPGQRVHFQAVGRSVRGAAGHVRTSNTVSLEGDGDHTTVVIDGDVVLAGPLGSVGQKVVAKQAGKVTAAFAEQLRLALDGGAPTPGPVAGPTGHGAANGSGPVPGATPAGEGAGDGWRQLAAAGVGQRPAPDKWAVAALALAAVSAAVGCATYLRLRRVARW
jgi:carbon monoxide dehydrogenase subunit G